MPKTNLINNEKLIEKALQVRPRASLAEIRNLVPMLREVPDKDLAAWIERAKKRIGLEDE